MATFGLGNTKEGIKEDARALRGEAHELKQEVKDDLREKTVKQLPIPAFSDLGKAANDVGCC